MNQPHPHYIDSCHKCFEIIMDRAVIASCGHSFHTKCLKKMSDNKGMVVFPVCSYRECKQTITSFKQFGNRTFESFQKSGNSRTYEFKVGTTYNDESRSEKKNKNPNRESRKTE